MKKNRHAYLDFKNIVICCFTSLKVHIFNRQDKFVSIIHNTSVPPLGGIKKFSLFKSTEKYLNTYYSDSRNLTIKGLIGGDKSFNYFHIASVSVLSRRKKKS